MAVVAAAATTAIRRKAYPRVPARPIVWLNGQAIPIAGIACIFFWNCFAKIRGIDCKGHTNSFLEVSPGKKWNTCKTTKY